MGPLCGLCKLPINDINLHARDRWNPSDERELLLKVRMRGGEYRRDDNAHKKSIATNSWQVAADSWQVLATCKPQAVSCNLQAASCKLSALHFRIWTGGA